MGTRVRVLDDVHYGVTQEANPEDSWDRDDTYESHHVQGVRAVGDKEYFDLTVGFDIVDDKHYFLVYGIYSTGDSFGHDEGRIEYVGLYEDREVAEDNARRIERHARDYRDDSITDDDAYSVTLVTEDGAEYKVSVPWNGYFERLSYIEIERVTAEYDFRLDL